jgi:hypothetical protein
MKSRSTTQLFAAACLLSLGCRKDQPRPDPAVSVGTPSASPSGAQGAAVSPPAAPSGISSEQRTLLHVNVEPEARRTYVVGFNEIQGGLGTQRVTYVRLLPIGDQLVISRGGYFWTAVNGAYKLDTKIVTASPLSGAEDIAWLSGSWPDKVWGKATFSYFAGPRQGSGDAGTFARSDGKWKRLDPKDAPSLMTSWKGGAYLGVVSGALRVLDGPAELKAPEQRAAEATTGKCRAGAPLVEPRQIAGLATGELAVFGPRCDRGAPTIERWAPGAATSEIVDLGLPEEPLSAGTGRAPFLLSAASARSIYAVTSGASGVIIARLDGAAMRRIEPPAKGIPTAAWALPDGTLWLLLSDDALPAKGALFRLGAAMSWARYELPDASCCQGVVHSSLWASDAETAYVGSGAHGVKGSAGFVVSTKQARLFGEPPAALVDFFGERKKDVAVAAAPAPDEGLPPYTPDCKTPFVAIYDVSKNAPPDFTFPSTRKALSTFASLGEVRFVEYLARGKRKLGAVVPSEAVGTALIAHIKSNMKDEDPKLGCFAPKDGLREVPMR